MSGTCAIYVPERQLDVEEKMWVQLRAKNCTKYVFLGTYMAQTTCLKWSCAIYPLHFAFDIDGASQEIEPSTLRLEYIKYLAPHYHKSRAQVQGSNIIA